MRVLVTGGAGFIGSAIVRAYVAEGAAVTVIDDLSSGREDALPPSVELVAADIADSRVADVVRSVAPSVLVHAAAQVSVTRSIADPQRDLDVNVGGTRNILAGAASTGARIVFVSSGGAIYGEADGATEDVLPKPQSPYGRNKLRAEELVADSGLAYANARLANVYGPGQRAGLEGGVVAIFIDAVLAGSHVAVFGDGGQSRDFVFVGDVVRAIRMLASNPRSGTWNVGTGSATTVHELIAAVEAAAGRHLSHEHLPARPGEVYRSRLSVERIAEEIGWQPTTTLDDGLAETLAGAIPALPGRNDRRRPQNPPS